MYGSNKISACLVVYNEEKLIKRCLESIKGLVDEIIIVHDGECSDQTLQIAADYTDKIFIKTHVGIAEPLRTFTYQQAKSEWILQIDADEYFHSEDIEKIKKLTEADDVSGYNLRWELFNGKEAVSILGLQKLCLFRKSKITYQGLPQTAVSVNGIVKNVNVVLHHRPLYNNISWASANTKRSYWLKAHVRYFFPEIVTYECFNTSANSWVIYTQKVRRHPLLFMFFYPLKNLIGQLKNGLWKNWVGISLAFQQYVYYLHLYYKVWQMNKKLRSP